MIELFKELSKFNNIKFKHVGHSYEIDGISAISVTTLIGKFKPKFEHDSIVLKCATKIIKNKSREGTIKEIIEQLTSEWAFEREHACYEGIIIHSYMENLIANKILEDDKSGIEYQDEKNGIKSTSKITYDEIKETVASMKILANMFYKDYIKSGILIPVKSELILGCKESLIAGMLDQLFYNTQTETLQIWDYKTNKEIRKNNKYGHKLLHCLSHLNECQFNEYSVQLHLYKHLLETGTNLKIDDDCFIVWLNEKNDNYKVIKCLDMKKEAKDVIEFKKKNSEMFNSNYVIPTVIIEEHDYFSF